MRITTYILLLLLAVPAAADTLLVPSEYATIQAGLDAAIWGDTVLVECGTYLEYDILMKSGVTLLSDTGADDCAVIDAEQQGRVMIATGLDEATRIEGFTLRNGLASGDYGYGGGMFAVYADFSMVACRFETNTAEYQGGGAYLDQSDASFERCWFVSNDGGTWGGGAYTYFASPTFDNCRFLTNQAWFMGAGVLFDEPSDPLVVNCFFRANTADNGAAAVVMDGARATFRNTQFRHHRETGSGGALDIWRSPGTVVENCDFWRNTASSSGGAIRFFDTGDPLVRHCTFVDNTGQFGAAFYSYISAPRIEASIVTGNSGSEPFVCATQGGSFALRCANVWGNVQGDFVGCIAGQELVNDNFSANPLFCDVVGADFTLASASPCLPGASPCGELVGAYDQGCTPSATNVASARAVLHRNRPNPFNPHTTLYFELRGALEVELAIYDVAGRRVLTLAQGRHEPGSYELTWDGRDAAGQPVASGVYLARLRAGGLVQTQRLVLLR